MGLATLAVISGVGLSLLASSNPDGLEWSIAGVTGGSELESGGQVRGAAAAIQERLALLPDYGFAGGDAAAGTSLSGLVGAAITLALALGIGFALSRRAKRPPHGEGR